MFYNNDSGPEDNYLEDDYSDREDIQSKSDISDEDTRSDDSSEDHAYAQAEKYNDRQEAYGDDLLDAIESGNRARANQLNDKLDDTHFSERDDAIIKAIFSADAGDILKDLAYRLKIKKKLALSLLSRAVEEGSPNILNTLLEIANSDFDNTAVVDALKDISDFDRLTILSEVSEFYEDPNLVADLLSEMEAEKDEDEDEDNKDDGDDEVITMLKQMRWRNSLKEEFAEEEKFLEELPKLAKLIDYSNIPLTINRIITSFLYEARRHSVAWFDCKIRLRLLAIFDTDKKFISLTKKQLEQYIKKEETTNGTFYGVDLTDDSDSDDERRLQRNPRKEAIISRAKEVAARAEDKKTKDTLKPEDNTSVSVNLHLLNCNETKYKLPERAYLDPSRDRQVQRDLEALNNGFAAAKEAGTIPAFLNSLPTKFAVMQFRGITYLTSRFNAPARRAHRQQDEIGKPIYATEVLDRADSANPMDLAKTAEILKKQLLSLRQTGSVDYNNKRYANAGDAVQEQYTIDYDGYHCALSFFGLDCRKNPMVSTSDRGYHALRYAAGIKPYKGHEDERLRPRWRRDGRAERNKSGAVYISLHPLSDYDKDGPLSVPSMMWEGRMFASNEIVAERETTFPGILPADRTIAKHIIKYPSFHKDYKSIYQVKYGFDEELYNLFKQAIMETPPHSMQHKNAKKLLGDWLCAYQEVLLMQEAKEYAAAHNLILIYRQPKDKFGFQLFADTPHRNSKQVTAAMRQEVADKKQQLRNAPLANQNAQEIKADQQFQQLMGMFERFEVAGDQKDTPSQPLPSFRR